MRVVIGWRWWWVCGVCGGGGLIDRHTTRINIVLQCRVLDVTWLLKRRVSVWVWVSVCVCVCVWMSVCVYVSVSLWLFRIYGCVYVIYVWRFTVVRMYACVFILICVWICVCMYACMRRPVCFHWSEYVWVCVYMHVYIYMSVCFLIYIWLYQQP